MSKYIIVDIVDITNTMINLSYATNINTLRTNQLGTKAVMKFNPVPEYNQEVFGQFIWMNYDEILIELEKSEWSDE